MTSVAELFREKKYENLARIYLDWLIVRLGKGNGDRGRKELFRRYNDWVFNGKAFVLPKALKVEAWIKDSVILFYCSGVSVTEEDIKQLVLFVDDEIRNYVESELHHQNPLNP